MSDIAVSIEHVSKSYRLGVIGNGTLREDVQSWWARMRGKTDPNSTLGRHEAIEGQTLWALRDVSLDIRQGEVWGIIGRNGAGKSTLLKILSRVTAPTSGQIKVRGRVASLLEVGTGFHPELTGRENIFLNGAILGMTKVEVRRKLDEIIAFSEIEKFIDTPVKRYSSGMYVRLAFAVAAHLDPEILVVDEVLAVGDAAFQKKCLGKMSAVAHEGRTVLFVSHNMGAVKGLTQKAVWLDHGEICRIGEKNEVLQAYLESAAADSSHEVQTTNLPRKPGMGSATRVQRIQCNAGREVSHGEPLVIRLDVESDLPVHEITCGIGICNMDGSRLLSWDSDVSGIVFDVRPGRCVIELRVPTLNLQPSSYMLDVALRSGEHYFDYIAGAMRMLVLPGPQTPPSIVRGDGQVRSRGEWKMTDERIG
ncbi:MAG: ABC transporter ATP-binding protein [Verrucomicrobiota bacterium]|jgi:lipopolysaccharide transport system ATP-binding protein|nr:ABC transporter ATP-binding protein [Verrucomicrobiota bacterium]